MENQKPALTVVNGGREQPVKRIALSLVIHERKRLDIPLDAILGIDAYQTQSFSDGSRIVTYDLPHIEISLTRLMQQSLFDFTKGVVGEIVEIHIGERCISRPRLGAAGYAFVPVSRDQG